MDAEQPGRIGEHGGRLEARQHGQRLELVDGVLVGMLDVDAFAAGELEAPAGEARRLRLQAAQMDLDPPVEGIVARLMGEAVDVEVGAELG